MTMLMSQPSCSHGVLAWVPGNAVISVGLVVFSSCGQSIDGAEVMVGETAGA